MRRGMWVIVTVFAVIAGCDDGAEDGPVPDPTGDMAQVEADMTPAESDAAPGDPDAAPGDPDAAPMDPDGQAPDAAPLDPDAAPVDRDMALEVDMAPDPDAAPLNPDAFAPDPEPDPDMGPVPDAGPEPDAAPVPLPVDGICADCDDAADCQDDLGAEAQCADLIGGRGCLPGCGDNDDCAEGYYCLESRCTPGGARCDSCVVVGCPADQLCNNLTGQCADRSSRCGNCREDDNCAPGLTCAQVAFSRNCLESCVDGGCVDGFDCADDVCVPSAGFCDPCGGGCVGERPVCDFVTAECVQCAVGTPCPDETICDGGTCVEPPPGVECNSGLDCRDEALPYCVEQQCLSCRNDADCEVGAACAEGVCEAQDPCARTACQAGAQCEAGVCVGDGGQPACADDVDCEGDDARCNPATGQCYRANQQCDPDAAQAVCHPGSDCIANPLNAQENVCTCARRDPGDFQEPNDEHRIPCQPGGTCLQLGDQPGICASFGN